MKKVQQRNTAPEMVVRKWLYARGWRYKLHSKGLPGTPDIVFPARRAALFINGCFWHGHDCRLGRAPKSRPDFWIPKLAANRERSLGDRDAAVAAIEEFLVGDSPIKETRALKD